MNDLIDFEFYFILVYDSTVTIPDYTLYVTTGVTVALSYGLPDKPVYPEEELMKQYEMGRLPLLLRNDENVTETNEKGEIQVSTTPSSTVLDTASGNQIANYYYKYFQQRKPDSYYFGNSPLNTAQNFNKYDCNNRNCTYNGYRDNLKESDFNSNNVRPPYSPTFKTKPNNAFVNYMNDKYFKPWTKTSFYQTKTTKVPTSTT